MPVSTRPWELSKGIVTNANSPCCTSPSVHATLVPQRYGPTRRKRQVTNALTPPQSFLITLPRPDPTSYHLSKDILKSAKGGVIARSSKIEKYTPLLGPAYYTVSFINCCLNWSNQRVERTVSWRNNEDRNGRGGGGWLAYFHVEISIPFCRFTYTVFTLLSRARILRARCASGNNTGYFRWWCMSPALRDG